MATTTSAAEWVKRVRRWKRSGLTAAEYGAQAGFEGKQLSWWKWHLARQEAQPATRRRSRPPRAAPVTFVPARIVDRAPDGGRHSGRVEIVLANGRVVRVTGAVDASVLAQALRVAESDGAA